MSVGSVTSSSLQRDLISALRQTRSASAPQTDANAFAAASQGASASTGTTKASGSTASGPALSSDLMASLLQVQSDYSQISAQGGFAPPSSASSITEQSSADPGAEDGQDAQTAAPVHHHRGSHVRPVATDTANATGATPTTGDGTAAASTSGTAAGATNPFSGIEDGLQSLLQQVTKAIAAYATTGPVGLAATALTATSKT